MKISEQVKAYAGTFDDVGTPIWFRMYNEKFAELIIKQCGYYADIFDAAGCPDDMDPTETKPSDYIKKQFGVE